MKLARLAPHILPFLLGAALVATWPQPQPEARPRAQFVASEVIDLAAPVIKPDPPRVKRTVEETPRCGALTVKGKPCRNKVKGGGKCWRHAVKG